MNLTTMANDKPTPYVVVQVEYYKDGTLKVSCNADGPKVDDLTKAILEGALQAVENGREQ